MLIWTHLPDKVMLIWVCRLIERDASCVQMLCRIWDAEHDSETQSTVHLRRRLHLSNRGCAVNFRRHLICQSFTRCTCETTRQTHVKINSSNFSSTSVTEKYEWTVFIKHFYRAGRPACRSEWHMLFMMCERLLFSACAAISALAPPTAGQLVGMSVLQWRDNCFDYGATIALRENR